MEADEIGKFIMADKYTFSNILAEKLREDPSFLSCEVLWPEILKALSYMMELNKLEDAEPTSLAFYDTAGELWSIQKCGKLISKDDGILQFEITDLQDQPTIIDDK